jgi:hypothetical protein
MTAGTRRLERLYPALTGKEAAKLVLADYKAHKQHDRSIAGGLRDREITEYNRLVGIINFANDQVVDLINVLGSEVGLEEVRLAWLAELHEHVQDLAITRRFIKEMVKEPVTESELPARRKKAPQWRLFDVYKDEDADEVAALRKGWTMLDKLLTRRGGEMVLPLVPLEDGETYRPDDGPSMARFLATTIQGRLGACWTQLHAVRIVLDEYAEDFDGEDLLRSNTREYLDDALRRIETARDGLAHYIDAWELPSDHSHATGLAHKLAAQVMDELAGS